MLLQFEQVYFKGYSMSARVKKSHQVRDLEVEIAVYDRLILKERKKIKKWQKLIKYETFLWKELFKLGCPLPLSVHSRSLQATINIEKRYPDKIRAATRRIERLEGNIWRRNHELELCAK